MKIFVFFFSLPPFFSLFSLSFFFLFSIFFVFQFTAEQFQRATTLSAPRIEMNPTTYISIHQLKREVDSYKQRQQEIVSFDQVSDGKTKGKSSEYLINSR